MNSHTTEKFRKAYADLPQEIRKQARDTYRLFLGNPYHPSLRFKQIHSGRPIYSVRIGLGYRALGVREGEEIIRFWIGSHADYDKLISQI